MVLPRRKIPCSDSYPQFFKIYVPDQSSQQLRIPPAFIKNFDDVLPFKSILLTPVRKSWRVDVHKVDDNLFLQEGWPEFVQENSLEFGDFLVFSYAGNSNFFVSIFGKNSCLKEDAITTMRSQKPPPLLLENQAIEPSKSNELICPDSSQGVTRMINLRPRFRMEIQKKDGALSNFVSMYPFFKVVMRAAYVKKGILNLPSTFHKSYMRKYSPSVKLKLSGNSLHSWSVNLIINKGVGRFSSGWLQFVKDNTLQEGDSCIFELTKTDNYVLQVSILRCSR